jgi:hypothetical protein
VIFVVGTQAMILRGSSELVIERPPEADPSASTRAAEPGGRRAAFGLEGMPMQLKTGTATVGIRGTGFYVEAQEDQTYFCTCYGTTEVAAVKQPEKVETISATRHDRPRLHPRGRWGRRAHPQRPVHQPHGPGARAHRGAGGARAAVRVPEGLVLRAPPGLLSPARAGGTPVPAAGRAPRSAPASRH